MSCIKLIPADSRLTAFPIGRPGLWALYEEAFRCFWSPNEINFSSDRDHYVHKLTDGQRHFLDFVLAFFATSDKLVNDNLVERFKADVPIFEASVFYGFQEAMEAVHSIVYSMQIDSIIPDPEKRDKLINAVHNIPIIKEMTEWIRKCTASNEAFPIRLLRMACVEGILFSGMFCAIFYMKEKSLLPGLCQANEFIARDEGLHTRFALYVFDNIIDPAHRPSDKEIISIIREGVELAKRFAQAALIEDLPQMNSRLMGSYIEVVADNMLASINVKPIYNVKNPFPFMKLQDLDQKANFFERKETSYSKPATSETGEWDVAQSF